MKKLIVIILLIVMELSAIACPVCDQRQPKVLRGITHGAGPDSNWDYLIIGIMAVIVLFTMVFSIKWLVKPGETSNDHIKRFILTDQ